MGSSIATLHVEPNHPMSGRSQLATGFNLNAMKLLPGTALTRRDRAWGD
jgi:hypothetical protein